jgi:hypothetical protein
VHLEQVLSKLNRPILISLCEYYLRLRMDSIIQARRGSSKLWPSMNVYRRRFILVFTVDLFFLLIRIDSTCWPLRARVDSWVIKMYLWLRRLVIEGTVSLLGVMVGPSHQFDSFTTHLIISKLKM